MSAAVTLALAAAVAWGTADFAGGLAGRRAPVTSVAFATQVVGLVAVLAAAPLVGGTLRLADLAWGAGAGIGSSLGVTLLYRGLAVGQMSVVAPVTAVGAACLPVVFGLLTGDRPGVAAEVGVVIAIGAVGLLGVLPGGGGAAGPGGARAGVATGLAGGVGFGAFFILLDHAGPGSGLWPLVGARAAGVLLVGTVVALTAGSFRPAGAEPAVLAAGVLDLAANVGYLLATRRGLLSIVALLASLYPAATVLLARVVLRERLTRAQAAGLLGAGAAIVLIAAG